MTSRCPVASAKFVLKCSGMSLACTLDETEQTSKRSFHCSVHKSSKERKTTQDTFWVLKGEWRGDIGTGLVDYRGVIRGVVALNFFCPPAGSC